MESSFGAIRHVPSTSKKHYPNTQAFQNDPVIYAYNENCQPSTHQAAFPHFPPPPDYPPPKNGIKVRKCSMQGPNPNRHCEAGVCNGNNNPPRHQYSNSAEAVS